MRKSNTLLQNIVRVLSANFWIVLVGFAGSFIFPRILSMESYALYHTYTLYVGYITILHLGFPSGMVINYAGKDYDMIDKRRYKSEMILLLSILSFFTCVFLGIYIFTKDSMCAYIMLSVIPVGIVGSYKCLYQAWGEFKKYTRVSVFVSSVIPLLALGYYFINNGLSGKTYIYIYLLLHWGVTLYILYRETRNVRHIQRAKVFSEQNLITEKTGFALVVGNYMNTLFGSADKQFVQWFFGTKEFAFYSFGMSMQNLMTVFITSIAQPLFPAMAQGRFDERDYDKIKKLLFIFGSFSGCAYFALSIIVKLFIKKYIGSLEIIGLYFVVFPAMAVVTCLYINLYKLKGMMKTYIFTLGGILFTAICLNTLFSMAFRHYTGIAFATALTYYIWLFIGTIQFDFLRLSFSDIVFLIMFFCGFFVITRMMNDIAGFVVYFIFICVLSFLCYRKEIKGIIELKKR